MHREITRNRQYSGVSNGEVGEGIRRRKEKRDWLPQPVGRESYGDRTGSGIELQTSNMEGPAKVLFPQSSTCSIGLA